MRQDRVFSAALTVDNLTLGQVVIGGGTSNSLTTVAINGTGSILATTGATGIVMTGSLQGTASFATIASSILGGKATHIPYFITDTTLATSSLYQSGSSTVIINQDNATTANPEALYVWQPSSTSINVISGKGNLNNYLQLNIQNTNQGVSASSDVVATANNGTETTNYIDMGINSQNYSQNYIGAANDAYLYSTGNDLHIGNATPNKPLQFFVGGTDVDIYNKLQLNPNDQHTMSGSLDVSGSIKAFSFTGSLQGTASWATNAQTASYVLQAISASFASNGGVTQLLAGPNVTLSPTNGLGQVTISSTGGGGGGFNTATGSYGSFYDTTTQTNVAGTARSMSLNVTDTTNGVSISGSTSPFNTYIKVQNPGVYDIQFSAQVDKTDSGTDEIWIWIRKNGTDISDSATSIQLVGNGAHYVAAWNFFVNAAANDYFQLMWYSPDANVRLHAESAFGVVPGIPSLIVTANRVDQFLSNTGSFTGSFTGNLIGTATTASYISGSVFTSTNPALSASYALTASYAMNGGGGGGTPGGSPTQIQYNNAGAFGGVDKLTYDGTNLIGTGSFTGSFTGQFNGTITTALTASHAVNFTIDQKLTLDQALIDYATISSTIVGSNNLFTLATGSYTSAHGKYTIYQGANSRAGEFVTSWNGTTTSYYDNSTVDIGDTADIVFQSSIVTGQIQINAVAATSGWTVKMLATYL